MATMQASRGIADQRTALTLLLLLLLQLGGGVIFSSLDHYSQFLY